MSRRVWIIASSLLLAVCIAPFALAAGEGKPVDGGARNPSNNQSQSYTRETQIIANNGTYGTRQSNKSDNGGGAIYGCRSGAGGSLKGNEPCIRSHNLATGYAFELESDGTQGGTITVGNGGENTKPFTTNATGVADGLNADRVDGKDASDIVGDAQAQNRFAQVALAGTLGNDRGVATASKTGTGTYTVVFDADVSKCGLNATETGTGANGAASVDIGSDGKTVSVVTRDNTGSPQDRPFHITAIC
jgi:hypothetical protein